MFEATFTSLKLTLVVAAAASAYLATPKAAPPVETECVITSPENAPARFVSCVEPAGDVAIVTPASHCVAGEHELPAPVRIRCEDETVLRLDAEGCHLENDPGYRSEPARCAIERLVDRRPRADLGL